MKKARVGRMLFIVVIAVIANLLCVFIFGNGSISAYAKTERITNATELEIFLSKLKKGSYVDTDIIIDGEDDIDAEKLTHGKISFTKEELFEDKGVSITLNVGVKNILNSSYKDISGELHYGLFGEVEFGSIPVYYKIYLDAGEGKLDDNNYKYQYSKAYKLPIPTAPEGKKFIGWADKDGNTVTEIRAKEWGIKRYFAKYESEEGADSNDNQDIPDTPKTFEIVFEDRLKSFEEGSLDNIYTRGEAKTLPVLQKEGFIFNGWNIDGNSSKIEVLDEELRDGVVSSDDKIHLIANWELEKPKLEALNDIIKTYDGKESRLESAVSHSIANSLEINYCWYRDREAMELYSESISIGFLSVLEEREFMLCVSVYHKESGLSSQATSEWVKVRIDKAELSFCKTDGISFCKTYDASVSVSDEIERGIHYEIAGLAKESDISNVEVLSAFYDSKEVIGASAVTVTFGKVDFQNEELPKCYEFKNNTLVFGAKIEPARAEYKKLFEPTLTKTYDGTTDVKYEFIEGIDYEICGIVDETVWRVSASYTNKVSTKNATIELKLEIESGNYVIDEDTLRYSATILPVELNVIKLTEPLITKCYDGTKSLEGYAFTYGVDFELEGAVNEEIVSVDFMVRYDRSDIHAENVILTLGEIGVKEGVSKDNYVFAQNVGELYFKASITEREIIISGEDKLRKYGEEDDLSLSLETGVNGESITARLLREAGEKVGDYPYIGAEQQTPINSNYKLKFQDCGKVYKIIPAVPQVVFPSFAERDYDPTLALRDSVLTDNENYSKEGNLYIYDLGVFRWVNGETIPDVSRSEYYMEFAPNDVQNYDYTSVMGYNAETNKVTRAVNLVIYPIDPTPTEIADETEVIIGMRYGSIELPRGWSIVESEEISLAEIANGEVASIKVYENALCYTHDDTENYNRLYKDLSVRFVLPEVAYVSENENKTSGIPVGIIGEPNGNICINITLENPFEKVGYKVGKWKLSDGTEIVPEEGEIGIGKAYKIENSDLVEKEILIEVIWEARSDIPVTLYHFYENQAGTFDDTATEVNNDKFGTAEAIYTIGATDLKLQQGFNYLGAKLEEEGEFVDNFIVSPRGDSAVYLYYARKEVEIEYIGEDSEDLMPVGKLPSGKRVKYGVPFELDKAADYVVHGYSCLGYTDGITYDGAKLKVFSDSYVVEYDVEKITFKIQFSPNTDTAYIIRRYFDGEEKMQTLYGTTGEFIDISSERYEGYEKSASENEKLKGKISGYVLNENGKVEKGEMLELCVYYVSKTYSVNLPEELGDNFTAKSGESIILPSPETIMEGKVFLGWLIGGKLYKAGESFVMPGSDVVLVPQWSDIEEEKPHSPIEQPDEPNVKPEETDNQVSSETEEIKKPALDSGAIVGIAVGSALAIVVAAIVSAVIGKKQKERARLIRNLQASRENGSDKNR